MTKEELKEYLIKNLSIELEVDKDYDSTTLDIKLKLENEIISRDHINIESLKE